MSWSNSLFVFFSISMLCVDSLPNLELRNADKCWLYHMPMANIEPQCFDGHSGVKQNNNQKQIMMEKRDGH